MAVSVYYTWSLFSPDISSLNSPSSTSSLCAAGTKPHCSFVSVDNTATSCSASMKSHVSWPLAQILDFSIELASSSTYSIYLQNCKLVSFASFSVAIDEIVRKRPFKLKLQRVTIENGVDLEYEDIPTNPQMRHYVIVKCADLIGWIQYSLLWAPYDVFDIIVELSSLENKTLIVAICIDYLRWISDLYSDFKSGKSWWNALYMYNKYHTPSELQLQCLINGSPLKRVIALKTN